MTPYKSKFTEAGEYDLSGSTMATKPVEKETPAELPKVIESGKPKFVRITANTADMSTTEVMDEKRNVLKEFDSYLPRFVSRHEDGIDFTIEIETGRILNWRSDAADMIAKAISEK